MIIADSREQTNDHILAYFERHDIPYIVHKLDVGDYALEGNDTVRVERKKSLGEMAHNLFGTDKARFYREIRRAREQGIKLIILCEHGGIRNLADVSRWKPRYGRVTGKSLSDAIFRLEIAYGTIVLFCDKRSTGKRIIEILTSGGDENGIQN